MYKLICVHCDVEYPPDSIVYNCEKCGHLLAVKYDLDDIHVTHDELLKREIDVWRYKEFLSVRIDPVSLHEGGTTLYHLKKIGEELGLKNLYAKHEGLNPSGSFKDRGMILGVSMAKQLGKNIVACASTRNTAASMAVYAAKANMSAVVLLPAGHVAIGKVAQALMHGAKVIPIRGNFDRALEMVHELSVSHGIYLLNSINPYRLEGQKTIGFEAVDQLGCVPDRFILPVGNAGNISAILKDLNEWKNIGYIDSLPMMISIQAEGARPIVNAIKCKLPEVVVEQNSLPMQKFLQCSVTLPAKKVSVLSQHLQHPLQVSRNWKNRAFSTRMKRLSVWSPATC